MRNPLAQPQQILKKGSVYINDVGPFLVLSDPCKITGYASERVAIMWLDDHRIVLVECFVYHDEREIFVGSEQNE